MSLRRVCVMRLTVADRQMNPVGTAIFHRRDIFALSGKLADGNENMIEEAKSLLDAREDVIKSLDQNKVDAWRLAIGRTIDNLMLQ